jgi:hypothetical protein
MLKLPTRIQVYCFSASNLTERGPNLSEISNCNVGLVRILAIPSCHSLGIIYFPSVWELSATLE